MIDHYKIGNRIALLRREKGLTGEKFAELLGVSPQAVSKWENGKNLPETALCYTDDRAGLYVKDTSACILSGIAPLSWGHGMDCCWGGSLYAALKYMGESYTYEQVMGMSGACYRINFTEVWDWSATDALVAFDYSDTLFHAIGYEQIWADRLNKDDRSAERKAIVNSVNECTLRSLVDERRCAAVFLGEYGQSELAEIYRGISESAGAFYNKWIDKWDKASNGGTEWRTEETHLLSSFLQEEAKIVEIAKKR